MPGRRAMRPSDVYELVTVGDPRVSPDGRTCAFVLTTVDADQSRYKSAIWTVPTDGSAPARRFTFGDRRDSLPRWSPDGKRIAFASNRADEKVSQLYVIPIDGGEAIVLTDLKESVDEIAWSPDGQRIAFTSRVRDAAYEQEEDRKRAPRRITRLKHKLDSVGWTFDRPRHIFVVRADGSGEPVQLTAGEYEDAGPAWSPDGERIAFSSARHKDWDIDVAGRDIYIVPADGGRPRRLTHNDGGCAAPSWSPDGKSVAYSYGPGREGTRHEQVAVVDVASREVKVLTSSLDRNCSIFMVRSDPVWDGDFLLFGVEDGGRDALASVASDRASVPSIVVTGEMRIHGYDRAGGVCVHVASGATALPELYNGDKRLTDFGAGFCSSRALAAPERFTATSSDGSQVDAWIIRPAGFRAGRRYPVLLNIHGGPFTQYGVGFFDEFQVYAGAGYAVVYSNPRGSSGYSQEWGAAIDGPKLGGSGWGTVDYEDLMAVTDAALAKYAFCDPDRVGVMGGSYGGYMTSWIVSHTDRFKAACSERAVNYWPSMHGSSDFGWPFKASFGTSPYEDPEGWTAFSPLSHATEMRTPLLILHSENDLRCPIEQAEQLFTILRLLRRDVEFVRFPAESHELSRSGSPAHRVQRFEIILDWFDRKLKG